MRLVFQRGRRSKFNNQKVTRGKLKFASKKEASFYDGLLISKSVGVVRDIKLQPVFILQESFKKGGKTYRPIKYIADFLVNYHDGKTVIYDVKGFKDRVYRLKQKMFEYKFPNLSLMEI